MPRKRKRRKHTAGAPTLRIKTTVDSGEEGLPLELFDEIVSGVSARHRDLVSGLARGFVPIPFDRYVDLHVQANPAVDRAAFTRELRRAVDARKAGARCGCGALIWAIGSAEVGAACFTCITGEAWPDGDYEIDEALELLPAEPPGSRRSTGEEERWT